VHSAALAGSLGQIGHDLRGAWRIAADRRSFGCYAVDIFFHRLLRLFNARSYNRVRRIFVEGGIEITYRRNRGDIYTVREIWIDEIYRLPDGHTPKTVVDLGAHIGLASLWFAKIYEPSFIVAVEAAPSNAALASRNLERNSVPAKVIEAAVGREDGRGFFREARASNLGRLGEAGDEVDVLSIQTLLGHMPEGTDVDLLKIDLEGE
jgi:FkbM family methyltransferase